MSKNTLTLILLLILFTYPQKLQKNNQSRITFITNEANERLIEWLKIRGEYITNTFKKVNFPNVTKTSLQSNKIFPIEYETIRRRFISLLNKTGMTERDQ